MTQEIQRHSTIIIGSGFGGSVAASTLVDAGEKVLLLERGPWRDTDPVRAAGIKQRASLPSGLRAITHLLNRISLLSLFSRGLRFFRRGLFDIHIGREMSVVCSNSVGGGSHVYSAMNTRPQNANYWDGYADGVSSKGMEEHYAWMLERMESKVPEPDMNIPNATPRAYASSPDFIADQSISQPAISIRLNGRSDDFCNNSFFGSANGAKATLDRVLLLPAMKKGLQVSAEHECLSIWSLSEGGYRLEVLDHRTKQRRYLLADKVIVAAGTLNTLRLLFRSREIGGLSGMPALGKGFGGNGDSVAWWALNQPGADFSLGTPSHGRFALRDYESGAAMPGPNITRYGFNGIDTLPLPPLIIARLRRDAILVGMGIDRADGVVQWKRGRLNIRYIAENSEILSDVQRVFVEIARRSGKPVRTLGKLPLTVHPLGGARLSCDEKHGVVNNKGEVFGSPGLYVADASALPAAPGMPPSMSIAAWARHVAKGIVSSSSNKQKARLDKVA